MDSASLMTDTRMGSPHYATHVTGQLGQLTNPEGYKQTARILTARNICAMLDARFWLDDRRIEEKGTAQ